MSREIMQMALATLKNCLPVNYCYNNFGEASPMYKKDGLSVEKINESIKSLEDALAQPEFDTPESHIVKWSIPVDPNNFGEPIVQPVQEPTECGYDETVGMCTNNPCCEQTPVAHLWECIGRWSAYLARNGEKAKLAPPEWLVDAVKDATARPTRPWVGLTDKERNEMIGKIQHDQFTRQRDLIGSTQIITEMYLKEKNHGN